MCLLQNYIRDQPDNVQSVKLVTETVAILDSLYLSIHCGTIATLTRVFSTLNEFTSGNQATRVELVDRKIVDYINVIIRMHEFPGCADEDVSHLLQATVFIIIIIIIIISHLYSAYYRKKNIGASKN